MAKFFKKYDWLIGLSLDDPEHIHDRYRTDKGHHKTWKTVEDKAKMLLEEGVAVNAMCCITDYSSDKAEELYNYYKNLGLTWMQFIPIDETDRNVMEVVPNTGSRILKTITTPDFVPGISSFSNMPTQS